MAGDRHRRTHADLRADRLGQDARRLPVGARPARRRAQRRSHAARVRLAAQGALVRRGEEPARAAARDRRGRQGRYPHWRHATEGAARHGPAPAGHPDHDARVAVPDAHEPGAGDLRRRRAGDRRRDPRGRADQARRPSRAHPRTARRGGRDRSPADRAERDAEPARGGRPLPGRPAADVHDRRHRHAQAARPEDPRPGRVDGRAGAEGRRPRPVRRPGGDAQVDLARDLPRAAARGARAPVDDHLRQQPARGRAARAAVERARGGADRPRAPRLAGARGAARRRGAAEGRRAAVPRRHVVARARHRHGRRRPRPAGRVAEVGHRRAAADRPLRPRRRRHRQGPHLPQVPRRPARVRGRREAHARGADRDDRRPAQPARRARAADRGDRRLVGGPGQRRRAVTRSSRARTRSPSSRAPAARERARHARRPLPVRGVRRAAGADRLGSRRGHDPRAQGRPGARDHERRDDPRPRAVLGQPARRPPRRRARRGDGLRGPAGPGVPARRVELADRGHHPRPRRGHARAGRPGRGPVLEGRRRRAAARARRGDRRVQPLGGRAGPRRR